MREGDGEGQIRRKTLPRLGWRSQSLLWFVFKERLLGKLAVGIGEDDAETISTPQRNFLLQVSNLLWHASAVQGRNFLKLLMRVYIGMNNQNFGWTSSADFGGKVPCQLNNKRHERFLLPVPTDTNMISTPHPFGFRLW